MGVRRSTPVVRGKEARPATLTARSRQGWQYWCRMYVEDSLLNKNCAKTGEGQDLARANWSMVGRLNLLCSRGKCTPLCTNNCVRYCASGCYLRVTLQTALDMLELLTCMRSVATPGLYYVLHPSRWNRMTTIFHDRFKTEKYFGTKFCYTLDRALQIFFDRATRWSSMAIDGEPDYLRRKAENLIERIEEGRALNIMLPAVLLPLLNNSEFLFEISRAVFTVDSKI